MNLMDPHEQEALSRVSPPPVEAEQSQMDTPGKPLSPTSANMSPRPEQPEPMEVVHPADAGAGTVRASDTAGMDGTRQILGGLDR